MPVAELEHDQLVVLAACLREMMMADGRLSESESDVVAGLARELSLPIDIWESTWSEAMRRFPNRDSARQAAREIQDERAREVFYAVLHRVAHADEASHREWDLLEDLDQAWSAS